MSVREYYYIEEQHLINEARKIALFTKHPPTLGEFREDLLKEYLSKFTPNQLTVKSGFIADYRDTINDNIFKDQTRQIDFLVYDSSKDVPFFETKNFGIIKPNTAYAAIEIKSNLTFFHKSLLQKDIDLNTTGNFGEDFVYEGTLIDAFKNIMSISNIAHKYNQNVFTAIFAYDISFDPMRLFEALDCQQIQRQLGIGDIYQFPMCICVPGKYFIMINDQDMFDKHGEAMFGEGFFSMIGALEADLSLPIQFFTNTYYNNLRYHIDNSLPDVGGIFNISHGVCNTFSKHFDLM